MKKLSTTVLLLLAFSPVPPAYSGDTVDPRLTEAISKCLRNTDPNPDLVFKALGEFILHSPSLSVGGLGPLGSGAVASLDGERNGLIFANKKWQGKKTSETEIVFTNGQRVIDPHEITSLKNLTMVIFLPAEVRYLHIDDNSGGFYYRNPPQGSERR